MLEEEEGEQNKLHMLVYGYGIGCKYMFSNVILPFFVILKGHFHGDSIVGEMRM